MPKPTMWAPTAAASPPLDPPGESRASRGFSVSPKRRFPVWIASPNSGQFAFPRRTAPAALRRSTAVEPQGDTKSRKIRLPAVARTSRVAMRSLTVNGTPASGPGSTPRAVTSSIDLACSIARSSRRVTIAFKIGLLDSTCSIWAVRTSTALIWRRLTRAAISTADQSAGEPSAPLVGFRIIAPSDHETP